MTQKYALLQKLWWVPFPNKYRPEDSAGHEVEVVKLGTKYITVQRADKVGWKSQFVFNKKDGYENSSHRPGRAWPTLEAHEAWLALNDAWDALSVVLRKVAYRPPPAGLTIEQISMIKAALEPLK